MKTRAEWGKHAEELVADYLKQQGFSILEKNYQRPYGEIDLIAKNPEVVSFVEVKMRHEDTIPLEMLITFSKQKRIIAVAREFMTRYYAQCSAMTCRFDVALVSYKHHEPRIIYIPNAFMESDMEYHARNF